MTNKQFHIGLAWFRRDLRDFDNAPLYEALQRCSQVYCVFVFDTRILDRLADKADRRVEFIWESIKELKATLKEHGSDLIVLHGDPRRCIPELAAKLDADAVFSARDYEPDALSRDKEVALRLSESGKDFLQFKDQVIFEQSEVLSQADKPFGVFTPYKNAYLKKLDLPQVQAYPVERHVSKLARFQADALPALEHLGFQRTNLSNMRLPTGMSGGRKLLEDFKGRISKYGDTRDYPSLKGPSYLSVHLRFGTVSIRELFRTALSVRSRGADIWLSELIWRDFYFQILHHHPRVGIGRAFKPSFESLAFENDTGLFQAWREGRTGYPLVDAAMRQLNLTGYMHNRLRMVTASFLIKDLLVDWRWGERYFADKLIDFDLSANNGGWQWAASTGCDSQPWFRIFNPITQSEKFDPEGNFIRKYVPELAGCNKKEIHAPWLMTEQRQNELDIPIGRAYPRPVVDHASRRLRALEIYKSASNKDQNNE